MIKATGGEVRVTIKVRGGEGDDKGDGKGGRVVKVRRGG